MLALQKTATDTRWDLDDLSSGVIVSQFDPGWPEIRKVEQDMADRDGEFDQTRHFGPRVISMQGTIYPPAGVTRESVLQRLASYCGAGQRVLLTWEPEPGVGQRQAWVRCDGFTGPYPQPGWIDFSVQWKAASSYLLSPVQQEVSMALVATKTTGGRTYNLSFDRTYPPTIGGAGVGIVTNGGSAPTWPLIRVSGDVYDAQVINLTTGQALVLSGEIAADEYLDVDMGRHTAMLNGTTSRPDLIDWQATSWWNLPPGNSDVQFTAVTMSGNPTALVIWQDSFLR